MIIPHYYVSSMHNYNNLPNPKHGHTTGGSGPGMRPGGETCQIQNTNIPRAGRVGAPGGAPAGIICPAKLGANRIICPENKNPLFSQSVAETSLQCFSKSTCRIQNPDIPRAGRVGEPGGAAGRGRARLGANRTIRPKTKVHRTFQSIENKSLQRLSRNTNKRNSM